MPQFESVLKIRDHRIRTDIYKGFPFLKKGGFVSNNKAEDIIIETIKRQGTFYCNMSDLIKDIKEKNLDNNLIKPHLSSVKPLQRLCLEYIAKH